VGIDLSTRENKQSLITKFFPSYKSKVEEPWAKGYEHSNLVIHPDLTGFLAYEFWKADKMFDIGYSEAIKHVGQIKNDINLLLNKKR
jgi:hypothetical protein